jgi:SAM-dependent methyltransferase
MRWLRKPSGDPLIVSMCSVKLGERLLVVGCADTRLIAALAMKTGLSGRACMVCGAEKERDRAATSVEEAGALIESFAAPLTSLPFEDGSFDVVVMRNALPTLDAGARSASVEEARRVTRPGGRCISIDDAPRTGIAALLKGQSSSTYAESGGAASLLAAAGFRAVRTLAQRQALVFVEGVKGLDAGKRRSRDP